MKIKHSHHAPVNQHAFDKALLTWRAPEYTHHEKSPIWFVVAGLIALLLVLYGLKTDGWTFSVAIIVFAGTYYLVHREAPKTVEVKISKFGVKIGRHVFPYSNLKSFWIVYEPPFIKKLYLRMASSFKPDVFIALEDADPVEVRRLLNTHLNELKGRHEPFSDTLVRLFRL
ncbi:hypothetical protein HYW83_03600 [Candidatus Peregrinibacteria bacterium]|nr:hypothetical protein [Candidatus Peregrinibacteria bacterium]